MIILAIESSCDEMGVAILKVEDGHFEVLANALYSQINIHAVTRGVVPEVAARKHVETALPIFRQALDQAHITLEDVDCIGVTYGPGLNGSLLIGIEMAKVIALATGKPLYAINHLKAHLQANLFDTTTGVIRDLAYPALGILVSGGHTELINMTGPNNFEVLGSTLDDAIGESFDKVAALLNLPYPGGPEVSKQALLGNAEAFPLPIAMKGSAGYNMSYSGLKTAVRQLVAQQKITDDPINDICASFQKAAIEQVIDRVMRILKDMTFKSMIVAGGVSANVYLRERLDTVGKEHDLPVFVPDFFLCTDNALMIAMATYIMQREGVDPIDWKSITSDPSAHF